MSSGEELLRSAVILDTETTGIARGSSMHELSFFDLDTRTLREYILKPRWLKKVERAFRQEHTGLKSGSGDIFKFEDVSSWREVLAKEAGLEATASEQEILASLKEVNPFLYEALSGEAPAYPHLLGRPPTDIKERTRTISEYTNIKTFVSEEAYLKDVLAPKSDFIKALRGKTLWIANVPFESKQLGAYISAILNDDNIAHSEKQKVLALQKMIETHNITITDPFYVTGKEVNRARVKAQISGDWTGVWRAYKENRPKANEVAVRDIQDVTRAFMSYGYKLGLTQDKDVYYGAGIDISFRLFGSLEADPEKARRLLKFTELHRAAEDAAISEEYVLKRAVHYTSALEEVYTGTGLGKKYIELAKQKQGPLYEASLFFARLGFIKEELKHEQLAKRIARAHTDILTQGYTRQFVGVTGARKKMMSTPLGKWIDILLPRQSYAEFTDMDKVIEFLEANPRYEGLETRPTDIWETLRGSVEAEVDKIKATQEWLDTAIKRKIGKETYSRAQAKLLENEEAIFGIQNQFLDAAINKHTQAVQNLASSVSRKAQKISSRLQKGGIKAAAGVLFTALSALSLGETLYYMSSSARMQEDLEGKSIVGMNYYDWLARQEEYYGMQKQDFTKGMMTNGTSAESRPYYTDFGSPYRGPIVSNLVLTDQELLQEREKYLREQYGAVHYDPIHGLFGVLSPFKDFYSVRTSMKPPIHGAVNLQENKYSGLQGDLRTLNLASGNWKVSVEDADTITIKRGGVRGALASFFGMNRGYTFRLAGIDAPETSHGSFSYHAPHPHAEAAKEALKSLIAGSKDLEIVYDPKNMTYGRMMGVVIADGRNLNFEAVRQGMAAHLPYGDPRESMIDYSMLRQLEAQAYASNRGLWAHPWGKAFYAFSEAAGERVTFNTLTKKEKLVQYAPLMSQLAIMEDAENAGQLTQQHYVASTQLGKYFKPQADEVAPIIFEQSNRPYNNYMDRMLAETANFIRTKGTNSVANKFSRKSGYGSNDAIFALDSMNSTNSVWTSRRYQAFEAYNTYKILRKQRQMQAQRDINQAFGQSPIGHTRM